MLPINSITEYKEISTVLSTTTLKTNVWVNSIFVDFNATNPTIAIFCDGRKLLDKTSTVQLPQIFYHDYCQSFAVRQTLAGTADIVFNYSTTSPLYVTEETTTSTTTATSTEIVQSNYFTQFEIMIVILILLFGALYTAIFGKKVVLKYDR
jgi:hypothetical protein